MDHGSADEPAGSTLDYPAYQLAVRAFLAYVCDPLYGWAAECERRFGSHPVQICHGWNTAAHLTDYEGGPSRRALTRPEVQSLLDHADAHVAEIRSNGKKGWLSAFRDATMLKFTYAWGLRRHEVIVLEDNDFGTNPKAPEFGSYGVLHVRHGKASAGTPPKRRSVLTVGGGRRRVGGDDLAKVAEGGRSQPVAV